MTKETNGRRHTKPPTASTIVTSAQEYNVGPGRPPKEHRFKPGQSGNPKGRKRKPPSLAPDLKRLFEQGLAEKVTLKQGDKERVLTMAEAGIKQLIAQFAKGRSRRTARRLRHCREAWHRPDCGPPPGNRGRAGRRPPGDPGRLRRAPERGDVRPVVAGSRSPGSAR